MKCFAWIDNAVKALAVDGKTPSRNPRKYGETRSLHTSRSNKEFFEKDEDRPETPPTPSLPVAASFRAAEAFQPLQLRPPTPPPKAEESLMDRPRPVAPDHIEKNRFSRGSLSIENSPLPTRLHQTFNPTKRYTSPPKKHTQNDSIDKSIAAEYLPSMANYVQSGVIPPSGRTLRRRNKSSTSTIFQNSPLAPVTIIVTTPDDDGPPSPAMDPPILTYGSFSQIHAAKTSGSMNGSTMSLPSTIHEDESNNRFLVPDDSRLKPPTDSQIDSRRLRKAQEYREIRKFIIGFMNTKGDQFPKKLRLRLMEAYSIADSDLDPRIVKRFQEELARDEGVALPDTENGTDADDLQILAMAFRSQIPTMTPTTKQVEAAPIPPFRGAAKPSDNAAVKIPLRTTSIYESTNLNRTFSEPNLHRKRAEQENESNPPPPVPSIPSTQSLNALLKDRRSDSLGSGGVPSEKSLKSLEKEVRAKRGRWGGLFSRRKKEVVKVIS